VKPERHPYEHAPHGAARHLDAVTIALGMVIAMAGIFAVVYAFRATAIAVIVSGFALVIAGLVRTVEAIVHRGTREPGRGILTGILHLVVGAMFLWRPDLTMLSLTLMLGIMFFAGGFGRIFIALSARHPAWGWALMSGALSVLLGMFVVFSWPVSSLWLVGTLVGVELLGTGIAFVAAGFELHRFERRIDDAIGSH